MKKILLFLLAISVFGVSATPEEGALCRAALSGNRQSITNLLKLPAERVSAGAVNSALLISAENNQPDSVRVLLADNRVNEQTVKIILGRRLITEIIREALQGWMRRALEPKDLGHKDPEDMDCSICLDPLSKDSLKLPCNHIFHRGCLIELCSKCLYPACPLCRTNFPPHILRLTQEEEIAMGEERARSLQAERDAQIAQDAAQAAQVEAELQHAAREEQIAADEAFARTLQPFMG